MFHLILFLMPIAQIPVFPGLYDSYDSLDQNGYVLVEHKGQMYLICHGNKDGTVQIGDWRVKPQDLEVLLPRIEHKVLIVHCCYCGRWPATQITGSGLVIKPSQRVHEGRVRSRIKDDLLILLP